jgi:SAM-dependent methyltransferase
VVRTADGISVVRIDGGFREVSQLKGVTPFLNTDELFSRYYFARNGFVDGTTRFHALCARQIRARSRILEIGAGPPNSTTDFLAEIGHVTGVDVSDELRGNPSLSARVVYDGDRLPFGAETFGACVSNYVLEHIANPAIHFREVARVLQKGGVYIVRTPNLLHYVALASALLPQSAHVSFANRLRGLAPEAHDPWPTVYRANRPGRLQRLAAAAGLATAEMNLIEAEPSYARRSAVLFYPMMAYERSVNALEMLSTFRASINAVFRKN